MHVVRISRLPAIASALGLIAACAHGGGEPPATAPTATYSGHGGDSVGDQVLAKFAPTPLPPAVADKVQALLDIRSPGSGYLTEDGRRLFFNWSVTGVPQVWRVDGPQHFPVQLTGGQDPTTLAGISPDNRYLVVSRDRNGEENPGLYLLNPEGGALRQVQHEKGVQTFFEFISDDSAWVYFRANDVKADRYTLYRWDVRSGTRETVFDRDGLWSIADHRPDGELLLLKQLGSAQAEYWTFDPAAQALKPVIGQGEREEYDVRYAAQAGEFLVLTPKLGEFRRLYRLQGSELSPVTPAIRNDVSGFEIDDARRRIFYAVNQGGYTRLHAMDARQFKDIVLPALPPADHYLARRTTRNGRYTTLSIETALPATSYVFDWQRKTLTQWHLPSAPEVDTRTFVEARLESYPARDGTKIPMFVWRPEACAPVPDRDPCPVIVEFHGGPEGQTMPGFNPEAQMYVDAGFVFAAPNVRGSDGYGKAWFHADDGPKRLDIITDIEDAARYVRSAWSGNGKEPRVGILGGSYGGYSALIGMTMFAGDYDVGVEIVGISNFITFLNNTAAYRRILRTSEYGDPDKDREALLKLSPITYVDRVKGPLLMIQGANDPRVPVGEAVQIQQALESKHIANQLMIFADEGHGARKRNNRALQLGHALLFFQQNLAAPGPSALR